jgi:RNase P/RNase MRP subunit p29
MNTSIKDEFIGKETEIVRSRNRQLLGMRGKIVDETRNSFKILVPKGHFKEFKIIMKTGNTFRIGNKFFDGAKLAKRTEERIKLRETSHD